MRKFVYGGAEYFAKFLEQDLWHYVQGLRTGGINATSVRYDEHVSSGSGPQKVLQRLFGGTCSSTAYRNGLIKGLYIRVLDHIADATDLGGPIFDLLKFRAGIVSRLGRDIRFLFGPLDLQVFLCSCHCAFWSFAAQVGRSRYTFVSPDWCHPWERGHHIWCMVPHHEPEGDAVSCRSCSRPCVHAGVVSSGRARHWCSVCRASTYV